MISRPPLGTGYSHELIEVTERVRAGQTESVIMPLQDTLAVQRVLNGPAKSSASITLKTAWSRSDSRPRDSAPFS